ncbi:hypothetical protein [Solirubrum puertoriconensis]|uniref:Uncharacterized protein n=1 Tax=Solirubrum puertoriconensis TaxID=1751427 RepID=A0A9X0HNF0_SOLP1|nr:hypothetical protein [Solirubrum puertoriconensis]KUG09219.1 hypothetical protein ASU33_20875 [Solirubrum puertoriconensis]
MTKKRTPHPLLRAWQDFSPADFPRLLAGDQQLIARGSRVLDYRSYDAFVKSSDFGGESTNFHLSLLPQPFIGNLTRASVFLLFLNPGFSPGDYYALQHSPTYAAAIMRNLAQKNGADAYPFFFLDPQFAWTAGGRWWQTKFRSIAGELANRNGCSLQKALEHISRHIACLEMYPYHSQSFREPKVELASKKLICQYVKDVLVPRALGDDAMIVAARRAAHWQLPLSHKNIIQLSTGEARGAHMTMNTSSGRAILQKLQELW